MSIQKIVQYPDPVLRNQTEKITIFDKDLATLAQDMADTMFDAPGVGLAAPQIGKSIKLIVIDTTVNKEGEKQYMAMVNPEIIAHEGTQVDEEGCLSIPELTSNVARFQSITVSYRNLQGEAHEISAENRLAVILQHEIDHLNGILFLDHLSHLKRTLYKKKVKKWLEK